MPSEDYLLKKVESIESRLENHVVKIELKLDQIVDIMRQVAALQEKETRNASDIQELKVDLKSSITDFRDAILRVHDRLDRNDQHHSDLEQTFNIKVNQAEKTGADICDKVKEKITNTDNKVESWINRGIGAWVVGSFMLIIIQGVGAWIVKETIADFKHSQAQILDLQQTSKAIEIKVNQLIADTRNQK